MLIERFDARIEQLEHDELRRATSCSCTGQTSGQSFEVACGSSQCVAGTTYTCPTAGNLVIGARCGDDDSGVASGEGCGFFTCRNQADCAPVGFCFSAGDGNSYCYPPPDSDGGTCASDETATSKTTASGPTALCVPSGCPSPSAFVP